MSSMVENQCANCKAPLRLELANNGVIRCEYCGSEFTLPKDDTVSEAVSAIIAGKHELDVCRFNDAYVSFEQAIKAAPSEPEAYIGAAFASHKVQYIKDEVNNRLQPICHEVSGKVFSQDKNYLRALSLATAAQRAQYEKQAAEIDYIGNSFRVLHDSGLRYDCFICVKVTDDDTKEKTSDCLLADDLYFYLKGKGYKPFFSEREMGNRAGADYEALILYALYTSNCMLVVCSDESYLNTAWVKNEYGRFLKLIEGEEKESDAIALLFDGAPIQKLPGKNGKLQGIKMSGDAYEKAVAFVERHSPEAKIRKRAEAARLAAEEEERKKALAKLAALDSAAKYCAECGAKNAQTAKFCNECGGKEFAESFDAYRAIVKERISAQERAGGAQYGSLSEAISDAAKKVGGAVSNAARGVVNEVGAALLNARGFGANKSLVPPSRSAAISFPSEFKVRGTLLVEYAGNGGNVTVPRGITGIDKNAFKNSMSIFSITLPDTVAYLSAEAFFGCGNLKTVTLSKKLKKFIKAAFGNERKHVKFVFTR